MGILGIIGALLVGITLGLLGAGGSILTVPVLYYLCGVDAELSTAYSLFIVGITALTGAIPNMRRGNISYKTAIVFAIPSMLAVYCTRAFILPGIPDHLFRVGGMDFTKETGIVLFFSAIMIAAALSMILHGKRNPDTVEARLRFNYPVILWRCGSGCVNGNGGRRRRIFNNSGIGIIRTPAHESRYRHFPADYSN